MIVTLNDSDIIKLCQGGDFGLHPAATAGARGLPSGWACSATPDGYFVYHRNVLWGC